MQFHLNGFRPGDPEIADASELAALRTDAVPETVDVLTLLHPARPLYRRDPN